MNAPELFECLRELLGKDDRSLARIAKRSKVSYNKIYRFHVGTGSLSLEDAETLHVFLTGKSFIKLPSSGDDAL